MSVLEAWRNDTRTSRYFEQAALEAVMDPERHGFLYFVSRNDGTHAFSKTREAHEAYVDKYQR